MKKVKSDFDREIAAETGELASDVATITGAFLHKLAAAIADGNTIVLYGFAKIQLKKQGGGLPPHARFNAGGEAGGGSSTTQRFRVSFIKSDILTEHIRRVQKEKHMEKFGVDESVDQEAMIKAAADGCPECGAKCERHGNTLLCPTHGSKPFEKKSE